MEQGHQPFTMLTFALEGSDAAAEGENGSSASKKRRITRGPRACDSCRSRKIKCNPSPNSPKCLHCISIGSRCEYSDVNTRKPALKDSKAYTEALEQRVAFLENALLESQALSSSSSSSTPPPLPVPVPLTTMPPLSNLFAASLPTITPQEECEEREEELSDLSKHFSRLGIRDECMFFGKASSVFLVHQVLGMRRDMNPSQGPSTILGKPRPKFWQKPPWECKLENKPNIKYIFPDQDLLSTLVEHYFVNANAYMPLLHRPTFQKSIREGQHFRDQEFAATLLLACAIGSRYCDDLRVRLDDNNSQYSAGWKYFVQVPSIEVSPVSRPSCYELQKCVLMVIFMTGSSNPRGCWTLVGTALRFVQDLGVHRRKMSDVSVTKAQHEHWKRIFWCLVCMDRMFAVSMGRSVALQDEDINVDLPIAVDDEYWFDKDGDDLFEQPPNTPSKIQFFNSWIQLLQIIVFSLRTVYSMEKTKLCMGLSLGKLVETVTEMDSALNRWFDTVPSHLRWDPHRKDPIFFSQSVALHSWYYNLQILTHRYFLLAPRSIRDADVQMLPSLAICTNAARTIIHISHRQMQRGIYGGLNLHFVNILGAAVVLYLNLWSSRNPHGPTSSHNTVLRDVEKAREIFTFMENRFFSVGRFLDILNEMGSLAETPGPCEPSNKRQHDGESTSPQYLAENKSLSQDAPQPTLENIPLEFMQMPFDLDVVIASQMYPSTESEGDTSIFDPLRQLLNAPLEDLSGRFAQPTPGNNDALLFSMLQGTLPSNSYPPSTDDAPDMSRISGLETGNMPMWPIGMNADDWGQYLANMSEWTHAPTTEPSDPVAYSGPHGGKRIGDNRGAVREWSSQAR